METKHMDEPAFAKIVKEFNAMGELIRARQDEKQALMNEFDKERKRFSTGRISQKTLNSSVLKTNKELQRLDKQIRMAIAREAQLGTQAKAFASRQSPKGFKATLRGITTTGSKSRKKKSHKTTRKKSVSRKKKPAAKKKPVKKKKVVKPVKMTKTLKKKELALDRKYQKKKK